MGLADLDGLYVEGWVKTSLIDYTSGICSTVFLAGCNMRCPYCHNPDLVLRRRSLPRISWRTVVEHLSSRAGLLDSVCFSGGEPTLRRELPQMMESVKRLGFKVKLDTNGTKPGVLRSLLRDGLVDYVAMDVKGPLDRYEVVCGVPVDAPAIEQSARIVMESEVPYEFRTTAHPQLLDEAAFESIGRWLAGARRYVIQRCETGKNMDPVFRRLAPASCGWVERMAKQCSPFFRTVGVRC